VSPTSRARQRRIAVPRHCCVLGPACLRFCVRCMSETHNIERQGTLIVIEHLQRLGRTVTRSARKTFDLVVDGLPAEVKCKQLPWERLDFIGLTDGQRRALDSNERFILFVVCNLKGPGQPEVFEIPSESLRQAKFKVESTHYIYGPELRSIAEAPNKITGANAGGPRQLPMRTPWAARIAQFRRSPS